MPANSFGRIRDAARLPVPHRPRRDGSPGGWVEINPRHRAQLAARGLTTARALLDLPGEVVSGHPDRHVVRVELPGWRTALYLKRQHRVGWRERLRQLLAGFGWASRCERECQVLRELAADGFPCPTWVACGEDGRGRAFLLLEELGGLELRRLLGTARLMPADRQQLADRLGRAVGEMHAAGFDTPDLTAKHLFIDPGSFALTLIDWQSARVGSFRPAARVRALAALHASLADHLADRRARLQFLRAYRQVVRRSGLSAPPFAEFVRRIDRESARAGRRRSIRDQRQPGSAAAGQRLVWLAGEAVCAVPDVAATWPTPPITAPFYGEPPVPGEPPARIQLPGGRPADLILGRSVTPAGRFRAWARGRAWRSPGVTLGRVLFHLQRYGIPAPQLLAFGQRETGRTTADWFVLSEPAAGHPLADWLAAPARPSLRRDVLDRAGLMLRQLHDAGCRYTGAGPLFRVGDDATGPLSVGEVRAVRIARRLDRRARRTDLIAVLRGLPGLTRADRLRVVRGYYGPRWPDASCRREAAGVLVAAHAAEIARSRGS